MHNSVNIRLISFLDRPENMGSCLKSIKSTIAPAMGKNLLYSKSMESNFDSNLCKGTFCNENLLILYFCVIKVRLLETSDWLPLTASLEHNRV